MLVVHWAKHNRTASILANGLRPGARTIASEHLGKHPNPKGVYVYPFTRNRTAQGVWRRQLKVWDSLLANYNGFVFRLAEGDFPLIAGTWYMNRREPERVTFATQPALVAEFGPTFSLAAEEAPAWDDLEIIIPRRIAPSRIIRVLRDREPRRARS